jgi:diaminopimelate epimerase
MTFTKYHGAGNSFVLVDARDPDECPWPQLAVELCAYRTGVGADGLLVALPSSIAAVRMRMFNPDGTEDMCGNGLRCVALHAVESGLAAGEFTVETLAGARRVRVLRHEPGAAEVAAEMGRAELRPEAIPADLLGPDARGIELEVAGTRLRATALSTGSAHCVILGPSPSEEVFQHLSPLIEHHPHFPERVSVMWTTVDARDRLRLRIWERGAGETWACGTGACAAAVAARLEGLCGDEVAVTSRGGTLRVSIGPELELTLTGPAQRVFRGVWPEAGPARRGGER